MRSRCVVFRIVSRCGYAWQYAQYGHFANTVQDAAQFHYQNIAIALQGLSVQISAHAHMSNATFPFVTVGSFESAGQALRSQTGIEALFYSPIVYSEQVYQWHEYTWANQWWLEESRYTAMQFARENEELTVLPGDFINSTIGPFIYEFVSSKPVASMENDKGEGPYAPLWLTSPPPFNPLVINQNSLASTFSAEVLHPAFFTPDILFSRIGDYSGASNSFLKEADHASFHKRLSNYTFSNDTESFALPHCVVVQPVWELPNDASSRTAAFIVASIAWDHYLINLLPKGVRGITVVLKNDCNQSHTYSLEGNTPYYVGEGDLHDPRYDKTEKVVPFYDLRAPEITTKLPGHCLYSFHVYATAELGAGHKKNIPTILTAVVAGAFFITAAAYFFYDWWCVRRRHEKVVGTAAQSDAIVSSLFPSTVRDRLYDDYCTQNANRYRTKSRLRSFMKDVTSEFDPQSKSDMADGDIIAYKTKPIADFFPDATVLFADIAGFTAWSSSRAPSQVFVLLETIYHSFDEIACRRKVYKVETIGDCYVAVAGLPDPIQDHAVVMAKFARAAVTVMRQLVTKLELVLGPDTADLSMRT
jgi:Adenylate and Guanylate cyclase catalytic domain